MGETKLIVTNGFSHWGDWTIRTGFYGGRNRMPTTPVLNGLGSWELRLSGKSEKSEPDNTVRCGRSTCIRLNRVMKTVDTSGMVYNYRRGNEYVRSTEIRPM